MSSNTSQETACNSVLKLFLMSPTSLNFLLQRAISTGANRNKIGLYARFHPPTYGQMFTNCPSHPSPLVQQIGNYTLADLNSLYKTYKHKRPKHILL